jgi:di/tricarboxylate transporter
LKDFRGQASLKAMTEFINNTTVVFIMFPLVLKIATAADLNPLFFLLAVSTAASGAFMVILFRLSPFPA